jgi:hypothetical protein
MRRGKLLAESAPHELLEQFECSSLEQAFLKLCDAQDKAITLNERSRRSQEVTSSNVLYQDRYRPTKVYTEIIYAVLIISKNYINLYYFITQINRIVKGISECKTISGRQVSRVKRFKALLAKNGVQFLRYYA